jgi:hypothetical protein
MYEFIANAGLYFPKISSSITYEAVNASKVNVLHKDGYNFYYLFPKKGVHLIINGIIMPNLVFVEYNGLNIAFEIDFITQKAKFFDVDRFDINYDKTKKARRKMMRDSYSKEVNPRACNNYPK